MGYMRHDAIVVTSGFMDKLSRAWSKARELGLPVSPLVASPINDYASFLIAPDGSKEGWKESDNGEAARIAWKKWATEQPEMWIDWAHVSYGGDEPDRAELVGRNSR